MSAPKSFSDISVLVVDDNKFILDLITSVLRRFQVADVRVAGGAEDAFRLLAAQPAHVVICDIQMAPSDGIDFLTMIRQGRVPDTVEMEPVDPKLPVIMLTGHAEEDMVKRAVGAGANGFLIKPLKPNLLMERIQTVLGLKR